MDERFLRMSLSHISDAGILMMGYFGYRRNYFVLFMIGEEKISNFRTGNMILLISILSEELESKMSMINARIIRYTNGD